MLRAIPYYCPCRRWDCSPRGGWPAHARKTLAKPGSCFAVNQGSPRSSPPSVIGRAGPCPRGSQGGARRARCWLGAAAGLGSPAARAHRPRPRHGLTKHARQRVRRRVRARRLNDHGRGAVCQACGAAEPGAASPYTYIDILVPCNNSALAVRVWDVTARIIWEWTRSPAVVPVFWLCAATLRPPRAERWRNK